MKASWLLTLPTVHTRLEHCQYYFFPVKGGILGQKFNQTFCWLSLLTPKRHELCLTKIPDINGLLLPFPTRTTLLKKIFLKWLVAVFHCDSLVDPAWPLGTATGWLFSKKINGKPNNTIFHLSKMSLTVSFRKGENIFVGCFPFFVKSF